MPVRLRWKTLLLLTIAFFGSRAIFAGAGVHFDNHLLESMWQYLDPDLLQSQLGESLFYLHSQPPGYDLLIGLALKVWPAQPDVLLWMVHVALGLGLTLSIAALTRRLGAPEWVSAAVALLWMLNPAAVLYENWFFYTHAEAALLGISALFLHRFEAGRKRRDGLLFFATLAALVLVRASFHLMWLVLIALLLMRISRVGWRRVMRLAAAPVLVASLWYTKNLVVFGSFTSSTWLGMNLTTTMVYSLTKGERAELIAKEVITPVVNRGVFQSIFSYTNFVEMPPKTGIPVLDRPFKKSSRNLNHLGYIAVSRRMLTESLSALRARPVGYLRSLGTSLKTYFHAASDYEHLGENARQIGPYKRIYEALVLGRTVTGWCWVLVFALPISLVFALDAASMRRRVASPEGWARAVTMLFLAGNLVYVTLVGTMIDVGENNRFRFGIDPFVMILSALALVAAARWSMAVLRRRLAARRSAHSG